jgi:hypothetical protein
VTGAARDPVVRLRAGEMALTRVPYFDIALDAGIVGMTAAEVGALPDAAPAWATTEGQVLIGQAVWVIESGSETIVVDPCGAADDFLRTGAEGIAHQERVAAALADAGVPVENVGIVFLSHLDGIGMAAALDADGAWSPMFPNARVVMTQAELDYLDDNPHVGGWTALRALRDGRAVDGIEAEHELAPDVRSELTAGHTPGHAILRAGRASEVVFVGHLAVTPLHAGVEMGPEQHVDTPRASLVLHDLIDEARVHDRVLIGPLWPAPGAATATAEGRLEPIPPDHPLVR